MKLHFLGLGAQRCGTTSLHAWLSGQPQLCLPQVKELQYFTHHHQRGDRWYHHQFRPLAGTDLVGELTPYYFFHPFAAERIKAYAPDVRLLVLLCDPVQRLLSHFLHSKRFGFEPLPLLMALEAEPGRLTGAEQILSQPGGRHFAHQEQSYLARSRYEIQLERYHSLFSADQILVLRSEDLFDRSAETLSRLAGFLGFKPSRPDGLTLPKLGSTGSYRLSDQLHHELRASLANTYDVLARRYQIRWDNDPS